MAAPLELFIIFDMGGAILFATELRKILHCDFCWAQDFCFHQCCDASEDLGLR